MKIFRSSESYDKVGQRIEFRSQWPGIAERDKEQEDYAFGPLQSFDHAIIRKGTLIKMHEHKNDEIISYLVKGEFVHEDSHGSYETIRENRYMLMSAGESFFHQEGTPHMDAEMLQIFVRPREVDLPPEVHFAQYEPQQGFRLIAAPSDAPLLIRQNVHIYDLHGKAGESYAIPAYEDYATCIYVFDGAIRVNAEILTKRDGATGNDLTELTFTEDGLVLAFLVDLEASMTKEGPFSGRNRPTDKIVSRMWSDVKKDVD